MHDIKILYRHIHTALPCIVRKFGSFAVLRKYAMLKNNIVLVILCYNHLVGT